MRRWLGLAVAALAVSACVSASGYSHFSTVPPAEKLPIDGLWVVSGSGHTATYRIDRGRMWIEAYPSYPQFVGKIMGKEIRQVGPTRYAFQSASGGVFGGEATFGPGELEVKSDSIMMFRRLGGSEAVFQKLRLDDEAWFAAQLGADRILARPSAPRPAPGAAIAPGPPVLPGALKARIEKLGGASWALVVGINAYRHADRLNYAVADAQAVAAALPSLGFPHVRVLLDEEATRSAIERAIYVDFKEKMGRDDRLFVFFAGHGITVELPRGGEEGYLIPVDGDPRRPEVTAIAMDEIRKMGRRVSARHIFFAIDSCFSGFALTRDIRVEAVSPQRIAEALAEPVVQVLTAGRKGQKAVEEGGHGLFTRRLLDGLRGLADREGRGFVTATELAAWLAPRVVRDSGGRQDPQYSALDGEGDFVFLLPKIDR